MSTAQLEADEVDLHAGLRGLAGMVAGARGVVELLAEVAELRRQAIPGVDGAGVALIDPRKGHRHSGHDLGHSGIRPPRSTPSNTTSCGGPVHHVHADGATRRQWIARR